MMTRSLLCAHCGTTIALETRTDPIGTRLLVHLLDLHGEIVAFDGLPRWAELLHHYFVLPSVEVAMPSVVQAGAPHTTTARAAA